VDFLPSPRSGGRQAAADPPSLYEQRDVICEHYRLAEESYGADRCLPDMRKFAIKYAHLHPNHVEVRKISAA